MTNAGSVADNSPQQECPMCQGKGKVGKVERGQTKCAVLMIMKRFGIKERQAFNVLKKTKKGGDK